MKLLKTQKEYAALQEKLAAAGVDVEAVINATEGTNPLEDTVNAAREEGAASVLEALGIDQADHPDPAAAIKAHFADEASELEEMLKNTTEANEQIGGALKATLGIDLAVTESVDLPEALSTAIAAKTAKQIAQAGHEPIEQPLGGDDVSEIEIMDMETARRALAEESDPARYKKIYNRIQELKTLGRN